MSRLCRLQYPWPDSVTVWYRNRRQYRRRINRTPPTFQAQSTQEIQAQRSMRINNRVVSYSSSHRRSGRSNSGRMQQEAQPGQIKINSRKLSVSSDDLDNNNGDENNAPTRKPLQTQEEELNDDNTFDADLARAIAESLQSHNQCYDTIDANPESDPSVVRNSTAMSCSSSVVLNQRVESKSNDCSREENRLHAVDDGSVGNDDSEAGTGALNKIVFMTMPASQFAFLVTPETFNIIDSMRATDFKTESSEFEETIAESDRILDVGDIDKDSMIEKSLLLASGSVEYVVKKDSESDNNNDDDDVSSDASTVAFDRIIIPDEQFTFHLDSEIVNVPDTVTESITTTTTTTDRNNPGFITDASWDGVESNPTSIIISNVDCQEEGKSDNNNGSDDDNNNCCGDDEVSGGAVAIAVEERLEIGTDSNDSDTTLLFSTSKTGEA